MLQRCKTLSLAFLLVAVGCSDNKLGTEVTVDLAQVLDLSVVPDLMFPDRTPSDHPALPQVENQGGTILAAPEVWTVVWPGDEALGAKVNTFVGWMLASDYWTQSLGEYGVGAGVAKGVYVMPTAAPATIDDSSFRTIIKTVAAALPEQTNKNTIISFIIPKKSTSTMFGGQSTGCTDYGGYHDEVRPASGMAWVSYAVNLQCADPTLSPFDALTDVMSHELAEASTDPHPMSAQGWVNGGDQSGVFSEIADLCVFLDTKITATFPGPDAGAPDTMEVYNVQRLYSQKIAAAENGDPCVPAPSTPYFGVALDPGDLTISLGTATSGDVSAKLEPFAYGAVGAISYQIYGLAGTGITATPDQGSAQPGETIRINFHGDGTIKGYGPQAIFIDTQTSDGTQNEWFGSIQVQ